MQKLYCYDIIKKMKTILILIFIIGLLYFGYTVVKNPRTEINMQTDIIDNIETNMKKLTLTSAAFKNNGKIPAKYTCDGDSITGGISPQLAISGVPADAKTLVLIMDDPDALAGTWDHWIIFNIQPATNNIQEGEEPDGRAGNNSWGRAGYGGPCPPTGTHRYFFKLFSLDTELELAEGASKKEIESAMEGHILQKAELIGLYERN
jgi:Raf kinase inhibitor-like YbhB/YbcL family protein